MSSEPDQAQRGMAVVYVSWNVIALPDTYHLRPNPSGYRSLVVVQLPRFDSYS
jgi:hypothetical protein